MKGGMKLAVSNPSQDSAFGSMTDGDTSIASSSFRLNSFQSISSPIDEGVEDLTIDKIIIESSKQLNNFSSDTNLCNHHQNHHIFLEPPTVLINDQRSIYSSPSKRSSSTVEVFSQKYRVSSFEDMSTRYNNKLKNLGKITFRSFEEERRIESAFTPIYNNSSTDDSNRVQVNNHEKYKKLTHSSFTSKIIKRKNNLIKSNESLLDSNKKTNFNITSNFNRGQSTDEIFSCSNNKHETELFQIELPKNNFKSKSDKILFSSLKIKQTSFDYSSEPNFSHVDLTDNSSSSSDSYESPTHGDACKLIGGVLDSGNGSGACAGSINCSSPSTSGEEEKPLLEGMEMSPISPSGSDEML